MYYRLASTDVGFGELLYDHDRSCRILGIQIYVFSASSCFIWPAAGKITENHQTCGTLYGRTPQKWAAWLPIFPKRRQAASQTEVRGISLRDLKQGRSAIKWLQRSFVPACCWLWNIGLIWPIFSSVPWVCLSNRQFQAQSVVITAAAEAQANARRRASEIFRL